MRAVQGIAVLVLAHLGAHRLLPGFYLLPVFVLDDAQLRHRHDLILVHRIGARHPFAGRGILHVGAAVIAHLADIERVVQNPVAPVHLAADRGVAPGATAGAGKTIAIQVGRDRAGGLAGGIVVKNPPHDGGLLRVDPPVARRLGAGGRRHDVIPIGQAAGTLARACPAEQATPGLLGQITQLHLRHHAHDADLDLRHVAMADRVQLDPPEAELVEAAGDVREVAAQPIDRFGHHHVKLPRLGIQHHALEAGAGEGAGAADRRIFINGRQLPALALNIAAADLSLIGN